MSEVQATKAFGLERSLALRVQGVLWPTLAVVMAAPITEEQVRFRSFSVAPFFTGTVTGAWPGLVRM